MWNLNEIMELHQSPNVKTGLSNLLVLEDFQTAYSRTVITASAVDYH
jgi:hypothetical protein